LGIYALMAIPFRSYLQPLIVVSAIPFGLIGAILGHLLLGLDISLLSLSGMIAVSGVVVNDNLVLVDYINRACAQGMPVAKAIREAGTARFRPIMLTSLTTFAGLTPLMLEKSVQAQFLIPMAVSLAFGVIFATTVSLLLIPSAYHILEDIKSLFQREPIPQPVSDSQLP
jgi:multidrug efflux pump subunit AcrB